VKETRRTAPPRRWALQDAKNKLSEVVDAAFRGEPQVVTRRGVDTAVIISFAEYDRVMRRGQRTVPSLAEYLLEIPTLPGGAGEFERIPLQVRDAEI
jgi:prevent-host-death family protein